MLELTTGVVRGELVTFELASRDTNEFKQRLFLSKRHMSTESGLFTILGSVVAQMFGQSASVRLKALRYINLEALWHRVMAASFKKAFTLISSLILAMFHL